MAFEGMLLFYFLFPFPAFIFFFLMMFHIKTDYQMERNAGQQKAPAGKTALS